MSVREIVIYPDEVLRRPCRPVVTFDDSLKQLAADMAETMYAAPGVGLAANQVGVDLRLFVVDVGENEQESALHTFVNPEIVERDTQIEWEEGCLSFPDIHVMVPRWGHVVLRAQDLDGAFFETDATELFAVALQHELDHLNGVSLADKVSFLKRKLMLKDLKRIKAEKVAHG